MKITRSQIKKLIKEYEQYVDEDGNIWDDEGNVTRKGKAFGRQYGGGTYGTNAPWNRRRSYGNRRKTSFVGSGANADKIAAVKKALELKSNNFLTSVLSQLEAGRGLSAKQNAIVKKILAKSSPEDAKLFEASLRFQLKRIIKEAIDVVNADSGEVLAFSDEGSSMIDAPEAAWPDLVKRLGLSPVDGGEWNDVHGEKHHSFELSSEDFVKLEDEVLGKRDKRQAKRDLAQYKADLKRLDPENLKDRLRDWAETAAREWEGDNPDGLSVQDVAFDLADSARYSFEPDEWDELLWAFDDDKEMLRSFIMDSMG